MTSIEAAKKKTMKNLAKARFIIRVRAPYICSTVYGFIPIFVPDLTEIAGGPIAVSKGMVLVIDPVWAAEQSPEVLAACLMHEASHVLRDHLRRISNLDDPVLGNIAGDLAINPDLRDAKWELPEWVLYPEAYKAGKNPDGTDIILTFDRGLTLEQYYQQLPKSGSGEGNCIGHGNCGGIAGNPTNEDLENKLDAKYGRSQTEKNNIRNKTIQEIKKHIRENKPGAGSMPGWMKELIEFKPKEPMVPWKTTLQNVVRQTSGKIISGASDYSLRRPSRRSYVRGMMLPGLISRSLNLLLVEDVSASMGTDQIMAARNEEISLFRQIGIQEAWLAQVDTKVVMKPTRVRLRDIPGLVTHGRGGTNFVPIFEMAKKMRPKPDLVVILSDGDGPAPAHKPQGIEVIWCIVPTPWGRRPAHWGHLVVCSDNQELRAPYLVNED